MNIRFSLFGIVKRLKKIKKTRTDKRRMFQLVKRFLLPGMYVFKDNNNVESLTKCNFSFCRIAEFTFLNVRGDSTFIKQYNISLSSFANYSFGLSKEVYKFNDYVAGFYKNRNRYLESKSNYYSYVDDLCYPVVDIIAFDDKNNCVIMDLVKGKQYKDKVHDKIIIEKLFEYAVDSPVNTDNNELTYLQHGDAKRNNVIWIDEERFIFIDLDGVSYKPMLFDVLHYCAMAEMTLNDVEAILNSNKKTAERLFNRFKLCFDEKTLDKVLFDYVMFFVRLGDCYEDIDFLFCGDTMKYPKTNELLDKIRK